VSIKKNMTYMRAIKKSNSTNKMHLLRILLLTASTLIVTACSNGPSSSEAEKAVKKTFLGGCSQIEMKEFTKTNGIQVSDRNYKVEAKYSVRLPSTSARQAHIQEALAALKKADAELQTANAVSQTWMHLPNPEGLSQSSRCRINPDSTRWSMQND